MFKSTFASALLATAWQFSLLPVAPASAQTVTAQPPQAEALQRPLTSRTHSTAIVPDPKVVALATATRAVTDQGLFAEEYDAILEAAQNDPQLFAKVIERIMEPAK
jgi:hypothetical protein